MGHYLSTMKRVEDEEAAAASANKPLAPAEAFEDGWKPGTELIAETDAAMQELSEVTEIKEVPLGVPRETLPSIGHWVVYHLREGDARNRRCSFPALVMAVDDDRRELMLWVVVDDGDTWMQDRVRPHDAPEAGWERVKIDALVEVPPGLLDPLMQRLAAMEDHIRAVQTISNFEERITAIESHPALSVPPLSADTRVDTVAGPRQRRSRRGR